MKLSYVLSIAAAVIIVFLGYSCYSNAQTQKAIVYVLEQDKRAGDGVSTVEEYVRNQNSKKVIYIKNAA